MQKEETYNFVSGDRMPFINALPCFGIIQAYRLVWIHGKFGGGKTSFAFAVAKQFLDQGYRLITNAKSVWTDEMKDVTLDENGHLKAVVILDEGGLTFKVSKQIEQVASYAAKMDVIYLFPSFWPPAKSAQVMKIQPLFSLRPTGIQVIIYKWNVDIGGFHDKGYFGWSYPSEIYGIYSRQDPGEDPGKIIDHLITQTKEFRKFHGYDDDKIFKLEEIEPQDVLNDTVNELSDAISNFGETLSKRKGRFRR